MRRVLPIFLLLAPIAPAQATLNVFACEPEWAALVSELAGDSAKVYSATTAQQDPHRIEARPSLIAQMRRADLAVCTGADLEAGWLPLLVRQSGNSKVQPGRPGYFEAAMLVERLDVPETLDRALGHLHAAGNPHVHTDPRRIATIAEQLTTRLATIDPANAAHYRARHERFAQRWRQAIEEWEARAAPLKGVRAVSYHNDWAYLYEWLGMVNAGTLEPRPGIPPSVAYLATLKAQLEKTPARMVIRTPHQDPRPAEWLSQQAGIPVVTLPYTVGGTPQARDLFSLFEGTIERLLGALP